MDESICLTQLSTATKTQFLISWIWNKMEWFRHIQMWDQFVGWHLNRLDNESTANNQTCGHLVLSVRGPVRYLHVVSLDRPSLYEGWTKTVLGVEVNSLHFHCMRWKGMRFSQNSGDTGSSVSALHNDWSLERMCPWPLKNCDKSPWPLRSSPVSTCSPRQK
jgi:hypothetical protein